MASDSEWILSARMQAYRLNLGTSKCSWGKYCIFQKQSLTAILVAYNQNKLNAKIVCVKGSGSHSQSQTVRLIKNNGM